MSRSHRPWLGLLLPALLLAGACTGPSASAPPLVWAPCPTDAALQCAELTVPLDRADPDGATVVLPVVKVPARLPEARIGALVLHRGGPGYSVLDYLSGIRSGQLVDPLRPAVYDRYDVIAMDQRGAGASRPAVRCFADPVADGAALAASVAAVPATPAEAAARLDADARFAQACQAGSGELLEHITTEDAARDLDALREALGEERLSFVGQSYGTFLGTVYANLFPEHVGRFVLDSVVDPAQAGGGHPLRSARLGSDVATAETMAEFLRLCAEAGPRCAFGDGDPAAAVDRLMDRLRSDPVELTAPDGRTIRLGWSEVLSWTGNWLYQPSSWEQVGAGASFLAGAEEALDDPRGPMGQAVAQLMLDLRDGAGLMSAPYIGPLDATALAVNCADNPAPRNREDLLAAVDERTAEVGDFGALRAWSDSPCAAWPVHGRGYRGPWDAADTAEPVLIMNSRYDPATPLAGAERLHDRLPNSVLLVHERWGHVTVQQSGCMIAAASAYLVDGTLPAPGTTCPPDHVPFSAPS